MDAGELFRFIGAAPLRATLARLAGWDVEALAPEQAAELDRQEAEIRRGDRGEPAGRALGPYVLVERLGGGATSEVWKAWDTKLRRWVALKEARLGSPASRERFLREARAASKVRHPHLIEAFDVGHEGDVDYLAMTLVEGRPLDQEKLDARGAAAALADVAGAVQALHEAGLIHRDIKPQNILRDAGGRAILADFGIARDLSAPSLTLEGSVLGTPHYMAPEQAAGKDVREAADVYALGATLYHLAGGRPPFADDDLHALLSKIATAPPAALVDVPSGLAATIGRAMEKRPEDRHPTAAAFAEDLRRFLRGESPGRNWSAWRRRLRWAAAGAVALALVMAIWIPTSRSTKSATLYNEGVELWARGDLAQAEAKFASAGEGPEALLMRGRCLQRMGRSREALELWNRILELDSDHGAALLERGKVQVARMLHQRLPVGRRSRYTRVTFKAPPIVPDSDLERVRKSKHADPVQALFLLGEEALKHDLATAAGFFGQFANAQPWDSTAHSIHGTTALLVGEYSAAEAALTKAIGIEPLAERFRARGDARYALDRHEAALEDYSRVGDEARRGLALQALGRLVEAEAAYDRAMAVEPSARLHVNRGTVRAEQKDFVGAKEDFEAALELDERSADAYHNLANIYFLEKAYEDALRHYDLALACEKGFKEAEETRIRTLIRLNQVESAIRAFLMVFSSEPATVNDPELVLEMATVFHFRGDHGTSKNLLRSLLLTTPNTWQRRPEAEKLLAEWSK